MEELLCYEQLSSMKTLGQRMPGRVRVLLFPLVVLPLAGEELVF